MGNIKEVIQKMKENSLKNEEVLPDPKPVEESTPVSAPVSVPIPVLKQPVEVKVEPQPVEVKQDTIPTVDPKITEEAKIDLQSVDEVADEVQSLNNDGIYRYNQLMRLKKINESIDELVKFLKEL